jgi:Glycosyltransferase family 87
MVLATAAVALFFQTQQSPKLALPAALVGLALVCLVLISKVASVAGDPHVLAHLLAAACLVDTGVSFGLDHSQKAAGTALIVLLYLGSGALALLGGTRASRVGFAALLAIHTVLLLVDFEVHLQIMDVQVFLDEGIDALLSGVNPYSVTFTNVFDAEHTDLYYGPGVVEGGRVLYGFPYLPTTLLLDIPGRLLGEVRFVHLGALLATAVLIRHLATDRTGRAMAVLLLSAPVSRVVVNAYWVEPLLGLLLALTVWSMLRGRPGWTGIALGLLLASKQYLVVAAPSVLALVRGPARRSFVVAAATAMAVVVPFLAWDPAGFWRAVVQWQFVQPFRDDAMSLLPGLEDVFGDLPGWFIAGPSLVLGLLVSALVAWRTRPGPTALALGMGLSLLLTVLFSKQAFPNYFGFIGTVLALAVTTWPRDDPRPQTCAPLSQGSRGSRDIVATR